MACKLVNNVRLINFKNNNKGNKLTYKDLNEICPAAQTPCLKSQELEANSVDSPMKCNKEQNGNKE